MYGCTPEPSRCLSGTLGSSVHDLHTLKLPFASPCTPELSLSPLRPEPPPPPPRFPPCSPGPSPGFSESPNLRFWAPQAPLHAFSGALQPFTVPHIPQSSFRVISHRPGPVSGPRGRAGSRRRGRLGGGKGRKALPAHQHGPRGRMGWERQRKFTDVSFVHSPGEKELRGSRGGYSGVLKHGRGLGQGCPRQAGALPVVRGARQRAGPS